MTASEPLPRTVLAAEVPRPQILAALDAGTAFRLRRGAYLLGADPSRSLPPARAEHRLATARIQAVARQLDGRFCLYGPTAALVWGLPLWRAPAHVHVVQRYVPGRGAASDLVRHRVTVAPDELTEVSGLPVTTLERTVLDCARALPAREGLVVADAALRRGADPEDLRHRSREARSRGAVRARAVLAVADPGAESPGESVTRYAILRHGLPAPRTQVVVPTRLGDFRADMGWDEWRLLVEFDGFVKYGELAGGDPARVLYREKRRQEAIEEEGWRVLRVTTPDLRSEQQVADRVRRIVPALRTVRVARPDLH
ncbi:very-short-patch-repair endonuclease [Cellulosimicrobium cellulans]|uniref:hypothetical protein n=1 Tax=Cellulosimicrobium cellulans TaxID=1710 RepID=UPI00195CB028|nr:hypothetical protein [Cellulosimicrobium cellulans]MBM7821437.1 very-short-patch-repair endonuclease [Cellulosimicrobium cellulans]